MEGIGYLNIDAGDGCRQQFMLVTDLLQVHISNHKSTHGNFTYNLEEHGFFWIFQSSFGLTMFWDKGTRIYIRLSTRHAGQVQF